MKYNNYSGNVSSVSYNKGTGFSVRCISDIPLSTHVRSGTPETYALGHNYPNPFNPTTTISYEIAQAGNVQLAVYNLNGQLIETLVNEYTVPGYYLITWDGDEVSSGIYFYMLVSGGKTFTGEMLLMK